MIAPAPKPAPKPAHVPRAAPLDRQTSRQLDKGKLEVEARLDLHGMRQRDAHAQLRRFLKTAQARGLKHVLVITGKGADQAASRSFYEEDERGVLRQAVPHWLADPEFATPGGELLASPPPPRRRGRAVCAIAEVAPGLTSGLILRDAPSALLRMRTFFLMVRSGRSPRSNHETG